MPGQSLYTHTHARTHQNILNTGAHRDPHILDTFTYTLRLGCSDWHGGWGMCVSESVPEEGGDKGTRSKKLNSLKYSKRSLKLHLFPF